MCVYSVVVVADVAARRAARAGRRALAPRPHAHAGTTHTTPHHPIRSQMTTDHITGLTFLLHATLLIRKKLLYHRNNQMLLNREI